MEYLLHGPVLNLGGDGHLLDLSDGRHDQLEVLQTSYVHIHCSAKRL